MNDRRLDASRVPAAPASPATVPEPQAASPAPAAPPVPTRRWPARRIILVGLGLWVLCAAAAAGANIADDALALDEPAWAGHLAAYGLHLPGVLLALAGTTALIIAALRWAHDGPRATEPAVTTGERQGLDLLVGIHRRLLLSETAKRIAYREQDLAALRQTIDHDIDRGHLDAGLVLVGELAQTYGYRDEAELYRDRIERARAAERDGRIREARDRVEDLIARRDFDAAAQEAVKLDRLYPDATQVRHVKQRVRDAREQYKRDLEREFLEAAERGDADAAMELLWSLDHYLTEAEAEPLRETARGVIGKRRDNLGVQFRKAVRNRDWHHAVMVGEQIIEDFPNTRMAEEVRQHIDGLRRRAAQQQAAHVR
ncbi:MAG: hypothetical protein WD009_10580 [Phycisphaeraceae bacterium]